MTKEEARERLRRLIDEGLIKTIGHAERREKALDAYAQACADAALEIERNTIIVQEANHGAAGGDSEEVRSAGDD
jgi:DNA-binding Lrp family transcriptional regulator